MNSFFIICDRTILPIAAVSSTEAIDKLFKAHFVLATEYDTNLLALWKFIQVYIYKLEVDNTIPPPKARQVFTQLNALIQKEKSAKNNFGVAQ